MTLSKFNQFTIATVQIALLLMCTVHEATAQNRNAPEDSPGLKRLVANTKELGELQRKFEELGGTKVATIKSKEDVENRIVVLDELMKVSSKQEGLTKENGGNAQDLQVLANLRGLQEKSREQLLFFKANYGKWKINEDGEAEYSVPKADLDKFAASLKEYNAIRIKQFELLQARAEARKKLQKQNSN